MPRAHLLHLLHHKARHSCRLHLQSIDPSASVAAAIPSVQPLLLVPHASGRYISSASSAMTKQKIVIRLSMASDKCRSKAMVLAAKADGVSKMGITGDGKDQLEVEGDGIDTVCLVNCLRKKIGHADIVKVEEVKPEEKKPEEKKPEEKKPEEKKPEVMPLPYCWYPNYNYYHYHPQWQW